MMSYTSSPIGFFRSFHQRICLSVCENCTYVNTIGTSGIHHIGIHTRLLLTFLADPLARPQEYWMKKWIDMTRFIRRTTPTGALEIVTHSKSTYWFIFCIVANPFRRKWALYGHYRSIYSSSSTQRSRVRPQISSHSTMMTSDTSH